MINSPDRLALINPISCSAHAMRYVARNDVVNTVVVETGDGLNVRPWAPSTYKNREGLEDKGLCEVSILDITTKLPLCDSLMYIAPFVTVTTPLNPDYAGKFMLSRLRVHIDGEVKVASEPVGRYLLQPPFEFRGNLKEEKVIVGYPEDSLLGVSELQFLTNGTKVIMELNGIPRGGGDIQINAGILMARYTTKAKTGLGFTVGVIDDLGMASPVTRTWDTNNGSLQDKLEDTHKEAIKELIASESERRRRAEEIQTQKRHRELPKQLMDQVTRFLEEEARRTREDAELKRAKEEVERRRMLDEGTPNQGGTFDLDETLRRAKRRLIVWGVVATWFFVCVGALVYYLIKQELV